MRTAKDIVLDAARTRAFDIGVLRNREQTKVTNLTYELEQAHHSLSAYDSLYNDYLNAIREMEQDEATVA